MLKTLLAFLLVGFLTSGAVFKACDHMLYLLKKQREIREIKKAIRETDYVTFYMEHAGEPDIEH